jgi:type IV fimbrial biogenesis protein FimT
MPRGFTLYELLVTMLVAGVIFGLGVPNLLEFTRNNRMVATANDLITSIHLARNEAVNRHMPVTLCLSPEPLLDSPECDANASDPDSKGGYVVWVDENADAIVDPGEEILIQRDDPHDITVLSDNGYLHFGANGYVADIAGLGSPATTVLFCDARGNVVVSGGLSAARAVRIMPTGRPTVLTEVGEISPLALSCP